MNLEIKEAGDARKIVNVSFDVDEMSEKGNQVCKELSRIANIPGFRKGKAPEQVIRKKYATEIIQELNRKVSTAAYEAVLENKDIKVYSILKVDAGDVQLGIPATVEVTVDIEPDFELPKYEEFELTTHPTEVKDEEVDVKDLPVQETIMATSTMLIQNKFFYYKTFDKDIFCQFILY